FLFGYLMAAGFYRVRRRYAPAG
ncbi:MAG: hypothetical protein FD129_835, partial [bacterium]